MLVAILTVVLMSSVLYSAILQHVFNDVEDLFDGAEWMDDDLVLTSSAAAATGHDGLKSPPPYSLQSTMTDFGNTSISTMAARSAVLADRPFCFAADVYIFFFAA